MMPRSPTPILRSQGGAAIIAALLVTALAAALATALLVRMDNWIDRVSLSRDKAQALELARSGTDYARLILQEDARRTLVDTLDEEWARVLPPFAVEGGELSGQITDLQGKWNLNNLRAKNGIDRQALQTYRRLLQIVGLPGELADTLADWMDSDDDTREGGAESAYYLGLTPPYRAANHELEHFSNLLRVKGYDPDVLRRLAPFTTVLPNSQPINVNTAPAEVLMAVEPTLDLADARQLVRVRQKAYFRSVGEFRERVPGQAAVTATSGLTVSSSYFLLSVLARFGGARATQQTLVERQPGAARPKILWQSLQ